MIARGASRIGGPVRVIAQTSALLADEVVARTRQAAECGDAAVMVLPPYFEGPTDFEGIVAFHETAARGGLPVSGDNAHRFSACACNGVGATKATASGLAAADDAPAGSEG